MRIYLSIALAIALLGCSGDGVDQPGTPDAPGGDRDRASLPAGAVRLALDGDPVPGAHRVEVPAYGRDSMLGRQVRGAQDLRHVGLGAERAVEVAVVEGDLIGQLERAQAALDIVAGIHTHLDRQQVGLPLVLLSRDQPVEQANRERERQPETTPGSLWHVTESVMRQLVRDDERGGIVVGYQLEQPAREVHGAPGHRERVVRVAPDHECLEPVLDRHVALQRRGHALRALGGPALAFHDELALDLLAPWIPHRHATLASRRRSGQRAGEP